MTTVNSNMLHAKLSFSLKSLNGIRVSSKIIQIPVKTAESFPSSGVVT